MHHAAGMPDFLTPGTLFFEDSFPFYLNRTSESFNLQFHRHDFVEIAYVDEGSGFHFIADETVRVAKGDLFVLPVGISHVFRPGSVETDRQLVVYNCIYRPERVGQELASFPGLDEVEHAFEKLGLRVTDKPGGWHHVRDEDGRFGALLRAMHREYTVRQPGSRSRIYSMFIDLAVQLERRTSGAPAGGPLAMRHPLETVTAYMETHLAEALPAELLAGQMRLSPRHFQRIFKQYTGQTFNHYLQNRRIERACELLRTTGMAVADVAAAVGYQDKKFFSRLFKARTGAAPGQYRRGAGSR